MKHLLLFALAIASVISANAQFTKGDRYLGGYATVNFDDDNISSGYGMQTTAVTLSPSFTKFKSEKRATGFRFTIGYSRHEQENPVYEETTTGIFGRAGIFSLRVFPLGKGLYLSTEIGGNLGYRRGKVTTTQLPPYHEKSDEYSINGYFTPAVGYKLTDRLVVGLNFNSIVAVGYTHAEVRNVNSSTTTKRKADRVQLSSSLNNTSLGNLGFSFMWKLR